MNIFFGKSSTDYFMMVSTWDTAADSGNGEFKTYYNGIQTGSTQTIGGVWVGNLTVALIGAQTTGPTSVWDGDIDHVGLANRALTAGEILNIWNKSGLS